MNPLASRIDDRREHAGIDRMRMARGIAAIAALAVSSASGVAADQQHLGIDRSEFQARFDAAQSRLHHTIMVGPLDCGSASIVRSCRGRIGEAIAFICIETFDKVEDAAAFVAGAPGKLQSVSAALDAHPVSNSDRIRFGEACAAIAMALDKKLSAAAARSRFAELYRKATSATSSGRTVATDPLGGHFIAMEAWDRGRGSTSCGVYPAAPEE